TAMTLHPYDDLAVSILPGRRRLGRAPAWRFSGARAHFCPACLGQADGRGPVIWRLPWSFACPAHHLLLLDFCPSCGRPPPPWNLTRLGPAAPGCCTRNFPRQHIDQRWVPCHSDLTRAPTVSLPQAGLVLNAHRRLAELLDCDADNADNDRPQTSAQLRK